MNNDYAVPSSEFFSAWLNDETDLGLKTSRKQSSETSRFAGVRASVGKETDVWRHVSDDVYRHIHTGETHVCGQRCADWVPASGGHVCRVRGACLGQAFEVGFSGRGNYTVTPLPVPTSVQSMGKIGVTRRENRSDVSVGSAHGTIALLLYSDMRVCLESKRTKVAVSTALRSIMRGCRSGHNLNLSHAAFELMGHIRRRGGGLVERLPADAPYMHTVALSISGWFSRCRSIPLDDVIRSHPSTEDFTVSMLYIRASGFRLGNLVVIDKDAFLSKHLPSVGYLNEYGIKKKNFTLATRYFKNRIKKLGDRDGLAKLRQ